MNTHQDLERTLYRQLTESAATIREVAGKLASFTRMIDDAHEKLQYHNRNADQKLALVSVSRNGGISILRANKAMEKELQGPLGIAADSLNIVDENIVGQQVSPGIYVIEVKTVMIDPEKGGSQGEPYEAFIGVIVI